MTSAMHVDRRNFLGTAAMTIAAVQLGINGCARAESTTTARPPVEGEMPSLAGATGWLKLATFDDHWVARKARAHRLLDLYLCQLEGARFPMSARGRKIKDHGLAVVGVHTPEFSFEHNVDNIRWALKNMKIDYPVAIDSDYAIWRAFNNEAWPALYFIDVHGHIRHHHFGEGEYEQSEIIIQQLLTESGSGEAGHELVSVDPKGAEVAADWKMRSRRKLMSAISKRKTLHLPVVPYGTSPAPMPYPPS